MTTDAGTTAAAVAEVAERYYDSEDADQFYLNIWGGEDIHIGLYQGEGDQIAQASRRTVEKMAHQIEGLGADSRALDIGSGYGGSARYLARTFGCEVVCLNISETENARNRNRNEEQGLSGKIEVRHGSFEDIPAADASFDVVWSQDAILHSGNRDKVVQEVARVLKPGGQFIFTDPMQADDCPDGVLQPVYDRIHLSSLGSIGFYREAAGRNGLTEVSVEPLTGQLRNHYHRVREELLARYDEMTGKSSRDYVDRMLTGLQNWVDAADKGYLAWGILHFRKT
ncbi:MAG: class I SAM-dependent methyltransferase [Bauldia litoralis]